MHALPTVKIEESLYLLDMSFVDELIRSSTKGKVRKTVIQQTFSLSLLYILNLHTLEFGIFKTYTIYYNYTYVIYMYVHAIYNSK